MDSRRSLNIGRVAVLAVLALPTIALTGSLDLTWNSIDAGGGSSTGGTIELNGTIGQPDAGFMSGGTLELNGGFWPAALAPASVPGDCDDDGDVDLIDYLCFEPCNTGPAGALVSGCDAFDFDSDNDVDLADFAELNRVFALN